MKLTPAQLEALERIAGDPRGTTYRFDRDCWTTPGTPLQRPIGVLSRPTWWAKYSTIRSLLLRLLLERAPNGWMGRTAYRITAAGWEALGELLMKKREPR